MSSEQEVTMSSDTERPERFKREVEQEWRNPLVTAAYRKWDREESEWGRAARDFIIDRARLAPGMNVLDVGSAHGEPGIAIAETVGPNGRVTLVDIAPDLLEIAAERARRAGLLNVTTRIADAHELPFPNDAFDRLTGRLVAMFFADPVTAFQEALRVLKPGGMAVYLVWGPFEQPMFRDILGVLFKYVSLPEGESDVPSPFKFSESGSLSQALEAAGFVNVQEERATLPTSFPHPPEQWWEWLHDGAAPVQTWMAALEEADREKALAEIYAALHQYYDGHSVNVPIDVIVGVGSKSGGRS
jgi:ubiquinone/menaquinone biosynthesis C-methylase UbiE